MITVPERRSPSAGPRAVIARRLRWPSRFNLPGILALVALVAAWQIVVATGLVSSDSLPEPSSVAAAAGSLIASGPLLSALGHTVLLTVLGWLIASVIGTIVGLALGLSRTGWRYSMASFEVLRALPGISFVPLAIVLFGLSAKMELQIIVYVAVWPVVVNMVAGVRSVTTTHADLATLLRMSWGSRVRKIVLPSAIPHLVVALRLSLATALALAVVAEMVASPQGVGHELVVEQQALQPARMFTYIVLTGLIGLALNSGLMGLLRTTAPGLSGYLRENADHE